VTFVATGGKNAALLHWYADAQWRRLVGFVNSIFLPNDGDLQCRMDFVPT
jgi:hypothetical protein